MDWKIQHSKNVSAPPNWSIGLIQFQSKHQEEFFFRYRQADFKVYMERQGR